MKELINDVRTGKTDKEVLCKEIQKDVNCLIYPVFGEDYKKLSPRAIIDICTNLDSIDVNKNIMRQIATRVSVFMFNLIDNSTIKIDDDYEYEYGRIKEDKELFDIIKDNSRIFTDSSCCTGYETFFPIQSHFFNDSHFCFLSRIIK